MTPDSIEQMLYERAVRTKIRAPESKRPARMGTGTLLLMEAVLAFGLFFAPGGDARSTNNGVGIASEPVSHQTLSLNQRNTDAGLVSIAMTQMGR